jgi:extradiol dioxygenase family protein
MNLRIRYGRTIFGFLLTLLPLSGFTEPVTISPWREAILSVTDIDKTAEFFETLGDYVTHEQGALSESELLSWGLSPPAKGRFRVIGPADATSGLLRLIDFDGAGVQEPMRPGARAWDTGCYFSLMVRVKGIESLYRQAIELGWWTETPIAPLQFGDSDLRIVIFKGPDGVQIQSYERLSPALPEAVGPFDRMTRPFNIMQMVEDHGRAYRFFTEVLGFDSFYTGPPVRAPSPVISPIGIPWSMTTEVGYQAGIVYPTRGEYGRMEMIQVHGLDGQEYRDRCRAPNLGSLAVRVPAPDRERIAQRVDQASVVYELRPEVDLGGVGKVALLTTQSPDGAIVQFYSTNEN